MVGQALSNVGCPLQPAQSVSSRSSYTLLSFLCALELEGWLVKAPSLEEVLAVVEASLEALPAAMDAGGVAVLIVKRPKGGNHYVTVAVYDQEHVTYHEPLRVRRWWGCGSGG